MRISNKKLQIPLSICVNQEQIEQVCAIKYLGIIIDDKLTFSPHMDTTS